MTLPSKCKLMLNVSGRITKTGSDPRMAINPVNCICTGNRINITEGLDGDDAVPVQRHISTPFFPMHYPRDYEVEYSLRCGTGGGGGGHNECQVHVNFIDFHLAPVSVLEVMVT